MQQRLTTLAVFFLRLALGWFFFYSGLQKILISNWSVAAYLKSAATFPQFYLSLAEPQLLPYLNFLNQWALVFLGLALMVGLFTRWASLGGAVLMLLYYFPVLKFPYVSQNYFLVDWHLVFALILFLFAVIDAGQYLGLDRRLN